MNNPGQFKELERIYQAALDQPAGLRAQFIERECGSDESLYAELLSLLEHDYPQDCFLEQPAIHIAARSLAESDTEPCLQPDTMIGHYRIVGQIARGGMGVVYRAEQLRPVRRMVALKIIKPGMDSELVVARFEAERQALALMDHPNIAHVLDAGTTSTGRLYFVMELVDGLPVTEYCETRHLDLRDRIALFIQICKAIQHAHQKGIVHRDIKPSNVLIPVYDGKPVPKVIDFGVAKAMHDPLTDRGTPTLPGAVIGTLEYMSPEQAGSYGNDIDTRSDIYSLGVLLYELIAGSTPLKRESLHNASQIDIILRIRDEELSPPSTRIVDSKLKREVRGDLDWVVMKAVEKDRTRRYETVNALSRELARYLAAEPVEAAPPSVSYRIRKFTRRHRVVLSTVTASTILLATALVLSSRVAIRASRAEQKR